MKTRQSSFLSIIVVGFSLMTCLSSLAESRVKTPPPLDIGAQFVASGWMGDGEQGEMYIKLIQGSKENPHSAPVCIKVIYTTPGPKQWAGIYWQNEPNNWGDKPGTSFKGYGYTNVTFWIRGDKGGEIVRFIAGGIESDGKKYKDSFKVSTGQVVLKKEWTQYNINLKGHDLSSVIGGFAFTVSVSENPEGIVFYLDDIRYENID